MVRVVWHKTELLEDTGGSNPPVIMDIRVIGLHGEKYPLICVGKEYALRVGHAMHYINLGVKTVMVVKINQTNSESPFRYHEMVEVKVSGFKEGVTGLPLGIPDTLSVSPEDLEDINILETDAEKSSASLSEHEEDPENGEHPPGWGMGV